MRSTLGVKVLRGFCRCTVLQRFCSVVDFDVLRTLGEGVVCPRTPAVIEVMQAFGVFGVAIGSPSTSPV
ncbi:MAG: hypothetical protein RLZZ11_1031 [Cyanobacteriota bacterium]